MRWDATEVAGALDRAGYRDLPPGAQAWVVRRLNVYGIDAEACNLGGVASPEFGVRRRSKAAGEGTFTPDGSLQPLSVGDARFESLDIGARELVEMAKRFSLRAPPLQVGDIGDTLSAVWRALTPAGFIASIDRPSAEATALYARLRADWESYEAQGVDNYPDLKVDHQEWLGFRAAWEQGLIQGADIAGRLNAEVVRSNRVRATLLEYATGKTVFVQDLPDPTKNIDTEKGTDTLKLAQQVEDWCKGKPLCDTLTNPSRPPQDELKHLVLLAAGAIGAVVIGSQLLSAAITAALTRRR